MTSLAFALLVALATPPAPAPPSAPPAPPPSLSAKPKLLQRAEPMLEEGARLLGKGDADGAIEHFRKAAAENPDERAIVEYDVGSAQLLRAMAAAKAQATSPAGAKNGSGAAGANGAANGATGAKGNGAATAPDGDGGGGIDKSAVEDAKASFERAFGLAHDAKIKSEAALAAGNAAATAQDLDDAIAHYRKSIVADPANERAKKNLQRMLEAKRQQQQQQQQQGGDKKDGDGDKDDKKNGDNDKKDDQKDKKDSADDKKDPQNDKKDGKDENKKNDDGNGDDKKNDDKQQGADNGGGDKKDDKDKQESAQAQQQDKKKQKKDEAKRLLDALRARERPMTPMEMRGQQKQQQPKQGKDW